MSIKPYYRVAESRKEAMASIDLMLERFTRIRFEEESRNGLVIVAAIYGKIVDGKEGLRGDFKKFFQR